MCLVLLMPSSDLPTGIKTEEIQVCSCAPYCQYYPQYCWESTLNINKFLICQLVVLLNKI